MKPCWSILAALLVPVAASAEGSPSDPVGQTTRTIHPAEARHWRGAATESLSAVVWYPAVVGGVGGAQRTDPTDHPIFVTAPVLRDAPLAAGRHPMVLLSHGTGGTARDLDWLAVVLAGHGYVVVGVDHPGNTALGPLTPEGFLLWWERATDLSDVLDAILTDPAIGPSIDRARIGAAGFSLGGYTVLVLAGARTDVVAFQRFCQSPAADATCRPPEAAGLASERLVLDETDPATAASLARSGASFEDARIRAVFAIAPALGQAFDAAGLAEIDIPVAIVAGDGDTTVPVGTNAQRFARMLPRASLDILPGGVSHYTFLNPCTPPATQDHGVICRDGPGVDRAAVHRWTAARALAFFNTAWVGESFAPVSNVPRSEDAAPHRP